MPNPDPDPDQHLGDGDAPRPSPQPCPHARQSLSARPQAALPTHSGEFIHLPLIHLYLHCCYYHQLQADFSTAPEDKFDTAMMQLARLIDEELELGEVWH